MADTTVTCNVSPCTVVIQLDSPLLSLDPTAGLQIAASIIGVWAVGFGFRALIRLINDDPVTEKEI